MKKFSLADHYVCLDEDTGQVRVLNQVAASMLSLALDGAGAELIACSIVDQFDVDIETAMIDSVQFLAALPSADSLIVKATESYLPDVGFTVSREIDAQERTCLYLPGVRIEVASELCGLCDLLNEMFTLESSEGSCVRTVKLDVYSSGRNFPIVGEGETLDTGYTVADTAIKCLREISGLVARSHAGTIMFHASAVARGNDAILMPAHGGSGKTTLAAYLMHRGYAFLNDDAVPMLAKTAELLPVPVSLSVKAGSWPVLANYFPQLSHLTRYGNEERQFRYLSPRDGQVQKSPVSCRLLIVPEYCEAQKTVAVECLSKVSVFEGIIKSGCSVEQPVQPEILESLVSWVNMVPCYKLTYSSLSQVEAVIDDLLLQSVSSWEWCG
ncbi:PqqD family peptide modification chaperone [Granulosicoccus antarcticus]|uniref:Uncharacterized protein n=1 Tax=Granulosicoccus antarcticus IMCC3135 TaxID=1192854 RepID=A0A2Z2NTC2_9GAMM|nr:PqqD family peptide modification chaperone [Granulosicoccus antarcticus]ASJ74569.1 hypothetical protein IMCC3135_22495 [Granulosicoccus antarcticus IMCC3135]